MGNLFRLRMRIKALNHTVDDQKKRITEYMANKSIAMLNGGKATFNSINFVSTIQVSGVRVCLASKIQEVCLKRFSILELKGGVEELISGYVQEIEELRYETILNDIAMQFGKAVIHIILRKVTLRKVEHFFQLYYQILLCVV